MLDQVIVPFSRRFEEELKAFGQEEYALLYLIIQFIETQRTRTDIFMLNPNIILLKNFLLLTFWLMKLYLSTSPTNFKFNCNV